MAKQISRVERHDKNLFMAAYRHRDGALQTPEFWDQVMLAVMRAKEAHRRRREGLLRKTVAGDAGVCRMVLEQPTGQGLNSLFEGAGHSPAQTMLPSEKHFPHIGLGLPRAEQ